MIFDRLCLGTANFGKEYNGVKVSEDEQKKILDYCQCSGIDMVDTAVAYKWNWTKISSYFDMVIKVKTEDEYNACRDNKGMRPYAFMAHGIDVYKQFNIANVSLYKVSEVTQFDFYKCNVVQVPYSIFDRRFEGCFEEFKRCNIEIHVRSIFLRGKLLEKFKPWECIAFCLANPYIDRVIIGVDSLQQLRDNLRLFHRMNSAEIHDENILDPRKWEGEK